MKPSFVWGLPRLSALMAIALILSMGCSDDNDDSSNPSNLDNTQELALIPTVAPDYSSGAHAVVQATAPYQAQAGLAPTISDISISTDGRFFYRMERLQSDSITKFDVLAPSAPIWQFSTIDSADQQAGVNSANPYALVPLADNKAYLIRYGAHTIWIVDPSVTQQGELKKGTLDLSAYGDADAIAEMVTGVIAEGKLFVFMQRLDRTSGWQPGTAYTAIFDTQTDIEIDTGSGNPLGLPGIALPVENPAKVQYRPEEKAIYVVGTGGYGSPPTYTGGIARIDVDSFETTKIVADGDLFANSNPMQITDFAILDNDQGYLVGYHGYQDNSLYRFNPSTGEVLPDPVAGQQHVNLPSIAIDSQQQLWVGTSSGVLVIDTATDEIKQDVIDLDGLTPASVGTGISFCQVPLD